MFMKWESIIGRKLLGETVDTETDRIRDLYGCSNEPLVFSSRQTAHSVDVARFSAVSAADKMHRTFMQRLKRLSSEN